LIPKVKQDAADPTRKQWLIALALILSVAGFYFVTLRPGHVWGDDFAQYIQHGFNLVNGRPYTESGYIYNPQFPDIGPRAYPPLFPFLLAPVLKFAGINLTALKTVGILFFSLALAAIFRIAHRRLSFPYALGVIAVLAFHPYLWDYKDKISSDIPFLCSCFVALWLLVECETRGWYDARMAALAGVAIYLSWAMRNAGAVLLPAMFLSCLLRLRRVPRFAWITISLAGVLIALHTLAALRETTSYIDSFRSDRVSLVHTLWSNVRAYVSLISHDIWSLDGRHLTAVFCVLMTGLLVWGYVKRLRSGITILELFTAGYFLMLLFLPWVDTRYLIPLLPLWLIYIAEAVRPALAFRSAIVLALLAASCVSGYARLSFQPIGESFNNPDFMAACAFLRDHTPTDSVVICRKPRLTALLTGRRSSAYALHATDQQLWEWFGKIGARYILTAPALPDDLDNLAPFLQRNQGLLREVFQSGNFRVYQAMPAATL
jgi:Dolichyl-phosphate-mannose-protein mannosyltransferase